MTETRLYTHGMVLARLNINTEELDRLVKEGVLQKPVKAGRYPADPVDKFYWQRFSARYPGSPRRNK